MELDLLLIKEYLALFVQSLQTITDCSCFLDKKSVFYSFCANFAAYITQQSGRSAKSLSLLCLYYFFLIIFFSLENVGC